MILGLSTRWNAGRHHDGEALVDEILALGLRHVELGYDLRAELVAGIRKRVAEKAITVLSLHNFCPVPMVAPRPHPELFTLAHPDRRVRESALSHTEKTIRFAAEVGARAVVMHCGNVEMRPITPELLELWAEGRQFDERYDKLKMKLITGREKPAAKQLPFLYEGIEKLMPVLEETGVALALENLPTWESFPTETEAEKIFKHFDSPRLRYWHDTGHGQVRELLGFSNHVRWLERLRPFLAGMHIHDVLPPAHDHLMPPRGHLNFALLRNAASADICRILEPSPSVPAEEVAGGKRFLEEAWREPGEAAGPVAVEGKGSVGG